VEGFHFSRDCIFCDIVAGRSPSVKVLETDNILAFMDIQPLREGHTLVIPKSHIPNFQDLEDTLYLEAMLTAKHIAMALELVFNPLRVGLAIAGWDVPHTHIHVLPMHTQRDLTAKQLLEERGRLVSQETLEKVAIQLRSSLS
jgi:histidine triad (HIT) family protein